MGQNSSVPVEVSPRRSRRSKPAPSKPPTPPVPPTPNYVVEENRVLPSGISDVGHARKLLRPVSQELTKFHPDFADIFQYDSAAEDDDNGLSWDRNRNLNKENARLTQSDLNLNHSGNGIKKSGGSLVANSNGLTPTAKLYQNLNGHLPDRELSNGHIPNGQILSPRQSRSTDDLKKANIPSSPTSSKSVSPNPTGNIRRSHSLERERPNVIRSPRHRRQSSLTPLHDTVIHEDPREHLYNVARHEPFSTLMPSTTSLPVKSSFELEYSMNLTYAQLAEYRRQKRQDELEEKTGRRLEELGAEISAASTVPKSPFDRANLGAKSATLSVSTGSSSDTGVSKSKKKRAPAPPPPTGAPNKARDLSPDRMSLGTEPPADYDLEDLGSQTSSSANRRHSTQLTKTGPQHAPILSNSHSIDRLMVRNRNHSPSVQHSESSPKLTPSAIPTPPPLPPSLTGLSSKLANGTTPQKMDGSTTSLASNSSQRTTPVRSSALQQSMAGAKAQLEALKKLEDILKSPSADSTSTAKADNKSESASSAELASNVSLKQTNESVDEVLETFSIDVEDLPSKTEDKAEINLDSSMNSTSSNQSSASGARKLSSLLQHDIVLAAQARGSKLTKPKLPVTLEKPKDASEMFREELAKAASRREVRLKELEAQKSSKSEQNGAVEIKEEENVVFKTDFLKVLKKSPSRNEGMAVAVASSNKSVERKDNGAEQTDNDLNDQSDVKEDKQTLGADGHEEMDVSTNSSRVFRKSWTPEDDLESDDDIMIENMSLSSRNVSNEGFKSSVVPNNITELKSEKKKKKGKPSKAQNVDKANVETPRKSDLDGDDKNKFGSIRRFRKSLHEGVVNAVGSISKASGKLLKRRKSQDFLDISKESMAIGGDLEHIERDPNWALGDDSSGSLRRSISDASIGYSVGDETQESISSEDANLGEDAAAVGDIDFATGLADETIPTAEQTPPSLKSPREAEMAPLKRAGVAYVNKSGQIVVLPEHDGGKKSRSKKKDGRSSKIFKKNENSYSRESKLKAHEKKRYKDEVSREIKEKEQKILEERKMQQEMETSFRKLQDLETQERLQRLQTASLREQISLLQRQQVQRAHVDLNSNNVPVLSTGSMNGLNTPFGGSNSQQSAPGYNMNTHSRYSMPGLNHPTVPSSAYVSHSAPLVSGGSLPNALNSQELGYLSECMRMMGVTPPATQQQWSLLLSTISVNNSGGIQGLSPNMFPGNLSTLGTGPDLSDVLGGGVGKDTSKRQMFDHFNSSKDVLQPQDPRFNKAMLQNALDGVSNGIYPPPPQFRSQPKSNGQPQQATASLPNGHHQELQSAPMIQYVSGIKPTPAVSETQLPASVPAQSNHHADVQVHAVPQQMTNGHLLGRPTGLPDKVYGPMGYRPVAFPSGQS